ncbi:MAG: response regulator [Anaerolineae bacterium]
MLAASPVLPVRQNWARPRILVVDDEPAIREVMSLILADEGYEVLEASDGKNALELVGAVQPNLILLDFNMPVMDGSAFMTAYKNLPAPRAPVVLVTASDAALQQADELGASGGLAKPFAVDRLLEVVQQHLSARAMAEATTDTADEAVDLSQRVKAVLDQLTQLRERIQWWRQQSMVKPMWVTQVTWAELVQADPRIQELLDEAERVTDPGPPGSFCASQAFWGHGPNPGFRWRIPQLVGWERRRRNPSADPILFHFEAYELVYKKIYEALPPCLGCHCIAPAIGNRRRRV